MGVKKRTTDDQARRVKQSRHPDVQEPPQFLDRRYYIDEELYDLELSRVFSKSWLFVAHESEIPSPGDYVTRPMIDDSVIVTRDERGEIHVLLNSCAHRGTQLCKASLGNTSHFRCSYHGWTYGNDGGLRAVPQVRELYGKDFDKSKIALQAAKVGSVHGLIFATWNPDSPSLDEFLGDIRWYLDAMCGLSTAGVEVFGQAHRFVHPGNWKLLVENGAGDGYHLQWTHRTAFDLDLFGQQSKAARGHVISTPQGHALRVQHPVEEFAEPPFLGYPEERWPEIRQNLSAEQVDFFAGTSVVHGALFPNVVLVHVAPPHGMDPGDEQTAFFQWRIHTPLSARMVETMYWCLVPKDYPEEWKQASYKLMHRQHGAAAFFESDDLENFRRIDFAISGHEGRRYRPFDYRLGVGVPGDGDGWSGPGNVVAQDLSEANQRAYYRRYLELMEV